MTEHKDVQAVCSNSHLCSIYNAACNADAESAQIVHTAGCIANTACSATIESAQIVDTVLLATYRQDVHFQAGTLGCKGEGARLCWHL